MVYNTFGLKGYSYDNVAAIQLPKVSNIQFASPVGVKKFLKQHNAFMMFGDISNDHVNGINDRTNGHNPFFVELSPYAVHFKFGYYNSLAWVTDLETGKPVSGAKVKVFNGINIDQQNASDEGITDTDGLVVLKGAVDIGQPKYDAFYEIESYLNRKREAFNNRFQSSEPKLLEPYIFKYGVMIEKGDDAAFIPFWYDFQINSYRSSEDYIYGYLEDSYGYYRAWGMTAQGIYRRGELVQFKVSMREAGNNELYVPKMNGSKDGDKGDFSIKIFDPMGNAILEKNNISLSKFGSYADSLQLNQGSIIGWYEIAFTRNDGGHERRLTAAKFYVSDFVSPPFKVDLILSQSSAKAGQSIEAAVTAKMYSGGPYGGADVEVNTVIEANSFLPITAKGFYFNSNIINSDMDNVDSNNPIIHEISGDGLVVPRSVFNKSGKLNNKGELLLQFNIPKLPVAYGLVKVETTVKDSRGRGYSARKELPYIGVDRFVGMRSSQWIYNKSKPAVIEEVVVNSEGELLDKIDIDTVIEYEDVTVAKTKTAGNVYRGDYQSTWNKVGKCHISSSKDDAVLCQFTPDRAGNYRVTASILDSSKRKHTSQINVWVMGDDYVLRNEEEDHSITINMEQKDYKIGDTARFMVQNPYPGAMALITVERNGIIDKFTQKFTTNSEIIELPIKPDYLPGFYLSIVIHEARADAPVPKVGQIDLGKPAMRIGYRAVTVNDPYCQLKITAKSDKNEYKPGDKASIKLSTYFDQRVPESDRKPIELAVAVIDAGIFDALDPNYFDVYKGFHQFDHLSILNYNLITRLIGKQKFETKGANHGGDGGSSIKIRNSENLTALWLPSITTNPDGTAEVSFILPDNLTEWKIIAVAMDQGGKSGYVVDSLRVRQNLQITPMMANQVRDGDELLAGFEIYNSTNANKEVVCAIDAEGAVIVGPFKDTTENQGTKQNIKLEPFGRKVVYLPLRASLAQPDQASFISFWVKATADNDSDGIVHKLQVLPSITNEVQSFTGNTIDSAVSIPIKIADNIEPNISKIEIAVDQTILQNISGIFDYMSTYPYSCWEQKISITLAAAYYKAMKLKDVQWTLTNPINKLRAAPSAADVNFTPYEEVDGLIASTLAEAQNYQSAVDGSISYFPSRSLKASNPYLTIYTLMAFNKLKNMGYKIPQKVIDNIQSYLVDFLRGNTASYTGYNLGSQYAEQELATLQALSIAALIGASNQEIDQGDMIRYKLEKANLFARTTLLHAIQDKLNIDAVDQDTAQYNKSYYGVGNDQVSRLRQNIFSNVNVNMTSSTLWFNDSIFPSFLDSEVKTNCAILSMMVQENDSRSTQLVNSILGRGRGKEAIGNTQDNAVCLAAIFDYSASFERGSKDRITNVIFSFNGDIIKKGTVPMSYSYGIDQDKVGREQVVKIGQSISPRNAGDTSGGESVSEAKEGGHQKIDDSMGLNGEGYKSRIYYRVNASYWRDYRRIGKKTNQSSSSDVIVSNFSLGESVNHGISLQKEYSIWSGDEWHLVQSDFKAKLGDLVRVDLYVNAPSTRYFVVVNDPLPGSLEVLDTNLRTTSNSNVEKLNAKSDLSSIWFNSNSWLEFETYYNKGFYFQEIRKDSMRFYSEKLDNGQYHLKYIAQVIAPGSFYAMPSVALEMYNEDIYGKTAGYILNIQR